MRHGTLGSIRRPSYDTADISAIFHKNVNGAVEPAIRDRRVLGHVTDNAANAALFTLDNGVAVDRIKGASAVTGYTAGTVIQIAEEITVHQSEILDHARFFRVAEQRGCNIAIPVDTFNIGKVEQPRAVNAADRMTLPVKSAGKSVYGLPLILRRFFFPIRRISFIDNDIRAQFDGLSGEIIEKRQLG